jgi:hypothetical protein
MHVLDRRGARAFECLGELARERPRAEGVEEVDLADLPVENLQPWLAIGKRRDGIALLRVESVLEQPVSHGTA